MFYAFDVKGKRGLRCLLHVKVYALEDIKKLVSYIGTERKEHVDDCEF